MPLQYQVTLLRILEEKQVVRIGGYTPLPLDVRVIAATNKDLDEEVKKGNFRLDLYYRLNILTIDIPPLRKRGKDILALSEYFLDKFNTQLEKNIITISPELQEWLLSYSWPGNVRELENIIERAVNLAEGTSLDVAYLPGNLRKDVPVPALKKDHPCQTLQESEKEAILDALSQTNGNITKAAKILGIGRNTLHRKMKELKICFNA
jgi:transcriptional regulator with PAS, ATPase and Fis domain